MIKNKIAEITAIALKNKILLPIPTNRVYIEPYYLISVVVGRLLKTSTLESQIDQHEKKVESNEQKKVKPAIATDPFRPPDIALTVTEHVSPYHSLVLNKFPVIKEHLLLITKEFESQTNHLNRNDFYASLEVLKQFTDERIVFYNRGLYSGASQPHKHVQIVPALDVEDNTQVFPLTSIFNQLVQENSNINRVPFWNFKHRFVSISHIFNNENNLEQQSIQLEQIYHNVLQELNVFNETDHNVEKEGPEDFMKVQCYPDEIFELSLSMSRYTNYNLLFSNKWLLVVLRSAENYRGISCNSLAFIHGLFAKNEDQLKLLRDEIGVNNILEQVTIPE
jgi:ATP adenylyltransferase